MLRCNGFKMPVCILGSLLGMRQTVGPIKWWYTRTLLFLVCTHCVSGVSSLYIFPVHLNSQDWGSKDFINVHLPIIKIMTAYRFTHCFCGLQTTGRGTRAPPFLHLLFGNSLQLHNLLKALIMSVADQQKESFVVFHNESWFTLLDSVGCTQVYRTPDKR